MKKLVFSLGLAASSFAMAYSPESLDFVDSDVQSLVEESQFHNHRDHDRRDDRNRDQHGRGRHRRPGNRMHACGMRAWHSAEPTDAQKKTAHDLMAAVKAEAKKQMPALKAAFGALKTALAKHPIVKDEVNAARDAIKAVVAPLRQAKQDAKIDILNSLSADQRAKFNETFKRCLSHRGPGRDGHHHDGP